VAIAVTHYGNLAAGFQAQARQTQGKVLYNVILGFPGIRLPDAEVFLDYGYFVIAVSVVFLEKYPGDGIGYFYISFMALANH